METLVGTAYACYTNYEHLRPGEWLTWGKVSPEVGKQAWAPIWELFTKLGIRATVQTQPSSSAPPPLMPKTPPPQLPASPGAGPAAADEPQLVEGMSDVEQSETPASAGPGSASPAAQEAELLDLGSEQGEQPDWSELNPEQACAVHVTDEVVETLKADLEDDAAIQSARSAATVEVRVALCDLPAFLKVAHGEGMPKDAVLDEVRAMKARGVEHVRYRSVNTPDDIESKAKISRMRGIVYNHMAKTECWDTWMMFADRPGPGYASTAPLATPPHKFITDTNNRSLWATKLKDKDPKISGPLRRQYRVLLSDLPDSAHVKLSAQQLETEGMSKAITNLVSLHAGEVVELDPRRATR